MSIQQVQAKNILTFIAQSLFSSGVNPLSKEVLEPLSKFFSSNPTGLPYKLPVGRFREDLQGNQEDYNDLAAFMITNIDTLYEVCFDHIDQIFSLNTVLQNHLDRLKKKRARLEDKIDDHLLSIFNSDGYFYSISDSFSETELVDFDYTTAYVDTEAGVVSLPSVAAGSRLVNPDKYADPVITIRNQQNQTIAFDTKMPFNHAIDGLTNTAWYVEVKTKDAGPFTLDLAIGLSTALGDTKISKIEITPYGIAPTKIGVEATFAESDQLTARVPFSNMVKTSVNKIIFNAETVEENIETIHISLMKNKHDYEITDQNGKFNVFIFGIKELVMSENMYDTTASLVSVPLTMPEMMSGEASIDGVSLVVEDNIPFEASLKYYVAADVADATSINDFKWKQINPVGWISDASKNTVVKFSGARFVSKILRRNPEGNSGKVIDFNSSDLDQAKRNPTSAYFPGLDVYRIAAFDGEFLSGTLTLEEGVNTTRIYYTDLDALAITDGFAFWKRIFDSGDYLTTYGQIDTGHGFFYGGDIGENAKSVYCETYINCEEELQILQKDCRKQDSNSQLWTIKLFLNGREIANLPVGTNRTIVPWKFNKGRNHIAMIANIPAATQGNSPYIGTFSIMSDDALPNYGAVNLDFWTYVDNHKFINNQVNDAKSFTIYNGELVSRRKPTDNYRINYHQITNDGPDAIRLRADFTRNQNAPTITPILDSYRVRFSYESDE
jgi:hypothetical protein